MPSDNFNKHLTLEERRIIEKGISNGATKTSIANTIGKDNSTVGKEIKAHRKVSYKCSLSMECAAYKKCKVNRQCFAECMDYVPFKCSRRDKSPGACNGCSKYASCRFTKYRYDAISADREYAQELHESREGFNLSTSEAMKIGETVAPLLKQGQSPYHIITDHPELGICEKTLYNYLEGGALSVVAGVANMDLRRQVSRKLPKEKKNLYKKRTERKHLNGRIYDDYTEFVRLNPNAMKTEMDTVYNDGTNGPFMQTFKFVNIQLLFAVYHESKTAEDMLAGVNLLDEVLGHELFEKHVEILVTDRGSEFVLADECEMRRDGTRRTRLYYCDPMRSGQKGSLEQKHEMLRYICPKETNLYGLGLTSQDALNLALSHINSTPVESLGGKSPLEACKFFFPDLYERLKLFGVVEIPKDEVTLKPYLLKPFIK